VSRKDRIVAYDALRIFAILSVVAIHTLMPYRAILPDTSPVRVLDDLLHYAVPLFVFISGMFVWSRPLAEEPGSFRAFMRRRWSLIGVPYLAWSAMYLTLLAVQTEAPLTPVRATGLLLTGHTWYHLYFIPMLLTFYLLTPVATRIGTRSPEMLLLLCYAVRILAGPAIAEGFRSAFGDLGWSFATHVLTHLPHMALGAWFAARGSRIPLRPWLASLLLAGGTAILLAASLGYTADLPLYLRRLVYPGGMAATVLGLTLTALLLEPQLERMGRPIVAVASLAFGIYFVHPLFLLGVDGLLGVRDAERLWMRPGSAFAVFAVIVAASYAVSALLARVPFGCRLIGQLTPSGRSPQMLS
jgi:surface polysaccharide O-acyltransferase-like enzyme